MEIVPLSCRPEFSEICASWSYGQWGCHINDLSLNDVIKGYQQRALVQETLPQTWIMLGHENQCIGMVSLKDKELEEFSDCTPWVGSLFVHSNFRQRGYAQKLMHRVEEETKKRGFEFLYLFTSDAEHFYLDKLKGWEIVKRFPDPIDPKKLVPLMKKGLHNV